MTSNEDGLWDDTSSSIRDSLSLRFWYALGPFGFGTAQNLGRTTLVPVFYRHQADDGWQQGRALIFEIAATAPVTLAVISSFTLDGSMGYVGPRSCVCIPTSPNCILKPSLSLWHYTVYSTSLVTRKSQLMVMIMIVYQYTGAVTETGAFRISQGKKEGENVAKSDWSWGGNGKRGRGRWGFEWHSQ